MISFICQPCRDNYHDTCAVYFKTKQIPIVERMTPAKTQCDCQHREGVIYKK